MPHRHTPSLSQFLRESGRAGHEAVERCEFFHRIASGNLTRAHYTAYLARLTPVYEALESAFDAMPTDSPLATLRIPGLWRAARLHSDLLVLCGEAARPVDCVPLAAHIDSLAQGSPHRLVAHYYVRYLGDLSGGQILAPVLARSLGLTTDAGLRFYEFGGSEAGTWKSRLRGALDALPLSPGEKSDIGGEVATAFSLHVDFFNSLPS